MSNKIMLRKGELTNSTKSEKLAAILEKQGWQREKSGEKPKK